MLSIWWKVNANQSRLAECPPICDEDHRVLKSYGGVGADGGNLCLVSCVGVC